LALCSQASIAGPSISTQAMPGVNFSSYKTYTWVQATAPAGGNPVMQQQILNDLDAALAQKGYQEVKSGGDLSLVLTIGAQEKTDIQSWGWWGRQLSVNQYTQGQLSLDAFDTKTQQAVWHGQASQTIDPDKPNPSKVDAAIAKLMVQFPATAAVAPQPQP
ncbi:MAG TPA: DUF4136 domain-containing protein, partial [Sphingomicrobium sp.]|nr:DUF4136 domain-containing protein [Sphingomicrobium sp.]